MRFNWLISCLVGVLACGETKSNRDEPVVIDKTAPTLPVVDTTDVALKGIWQLAGLPQSTTPFEKLYPTILPNILIEPEFKMMSGSTGCNRFSASITTIGSSIMITNLAKSKIACIGDAERIYLEALEKSTRYTFRNPNELIFEDDSSVWMVFHRR